MYLHYSILSVLYLVFGILIVIAAPILALFMQPPGCAITAVRNGADIMEWLRFKFLAYKKRTIVWHFCLMMGMRRDWFSLRDSWVMTKQKGNPELLVRYIDGFCFQEWALASSMWSIHRDDRPLTAFHYVYSKKWCKWFSIDLEFGWDFPDFTGAAFVLRVWPFRTGGKEFK